MFSKKEAVAVWKCTKQAVTHVLNLTSLKMKHSCSVWGQCGTPELANNRRVVPEKGGFACAAGLSPDAAPESSERFDKMNTK